MTTIQETRERWHAANELRAVYRSAHGEDESPEYERLADEASYWLQALLMARLREQQPNP